MQSCRSEVIQDLGAVKPKGAFTGFELHNDALVDQEVDGVLTDHLALVANGRRRLLPDFEPSLREFHDHRMFINLLEEAAAQRVRDLIRGADDLCRSGT